METKSLSFSSKYVPMRIYGIGNLTIFYRFMGSGNNRVPATCLLRKNNSFGLRPRLYYKLAYPSPFFAYFFKKAFTRMINTCFYR